MKEVTSYDIIGLEIQAIVFNTLFSKVTNTFEPSVVQTYSNCPQCLYNLINTNTFDRPCNFH